MTINDYHKFTRRKYFAMFVVWLSILLCFTQFTINAYAANYEQNKEYNMAYMELEDKEDEVQALNATMSSYLKGVVLSNLDTEEILTQSQDIITKVEQFLHAPKTGPETSPFLTEQTRLLQTATETIHQRTQKLNELYQELQNIPNTIRESQKRKQIQDAVTALHNKCDDASKLLQVSKDKVANESTRENLTAVIETAQEFLKNPSENLQTYQSHQKYIQDAMNAVNDSMEEQKRILEQQRLEEEKRRQEEARKQREAIQRPGSYVDGVWYIDYYNDYYQPAADPNGRLTQWYDNYFIAHDWSLNGQRILSTPPFVVVNGVKYKYVDCKAFSRQCSFPDDIKPFAFRNGGIAFQTCYGPTQILVTHYEPV